MRWKQRAECRADIESDQVREAAAAWGVERAARRERRRRRLIALGARWRAHGIAPPRQQAKSLVSEGGGDPGSAALRAPLQGPTGMK